MPQAPRIELHSVSQRVQVHVDSKLLADSTQALELQEIGYPPRHYFPREDVRIDLLTISERTTHCPLKGSTVYFSLGAIIPNRQDEEESTTTNNAAT
tara:strand:- start:1185 stop:1475 length:291 start_codon:yes stop_codon:yes gene_type:complete